MLQERDLLGLSYGRRAIRPSPQNFLSILFMNRGILMSWVRSVQMSSASCPLLHGSKFGTTTSTGTSLPRSHCLSVLVCLDEILHGWGAMFLPLGDNDVLLAIGDSRQSVLYLADVARCDHPSSVSIRQSLPDCVVTLHDVCPRVRISPSLRSSPRRQQPEGQRNRSGNVAACSSITGEVSVRPNLEDGTPGA